MLAKLFEIRYCEHRNCFFVELLLFFPSLLFSALLYSSAIATEHKVNHKLNFGYILPLFHSLAALLFFVVIFLLYEFLHCLYLLIHTYTSLRTCGHCMLYSLRRCACMLLLCLLEHKICCLFADLHTIR